MSVELPVLKKMPIPQRGCGTTAADTEKAEAKGKPEHRPAHRHDTYTPGLKPETKPQASTGRYKLTIDLTSSLLQLGKGVEAPAPGEGLYSLQELQFAAMSVTAWQSSITKASQGAGGSEVRQALTVSMISMKLEVVSTRGVIGKDMEDTIRSVQDSANEKVLDAMDEHQAGRRREWNGDDEWDCRFPDADRSLFFRVYQKVMDSFRLTGDAMGAIREGAAMAKPELTRAIGERGPAHRWESELAPRGYWDNFYGGAYGEGGFQSFVNDWNGFMGKLGAPDDLNAKA